MQTPAASTLNDRGASFHQASNPPAAYMPG